MDKLLISADVSASAVGTGEIIKKIHVHLVSLNRHNLANLMSPAVSMCSNIKT